jgi:hypothetical protein
MGSPAHPEATEGDQIIVIARLRGRRAALKYGGIFLVWCFALWALLPLPPRDAHQIMGVICIAILLAMPVAGFAMWFSRGGRMAITLKSGMLYLPGREFALDDVIGVRQGLWKNPEFNSWVSKYIEIDRRDGDTAMIAYADLTEDGDVVITRLKDALARHQAAKGPTHAP